MRFLTFEKLDSEKGIPWSRDYVRREIRAGRFPAPVKLGPRTYAWPETEIDDWLTARAADREAV